MAKPPKPVTTIRSVKPTGGGTGRAQSSVQPTGIGGSGTSSGGKKPSSK